MQSAFCTSEKLPQSDSELTHRKIILESQQTFIQGLKYAL